MKTASAALLLALVLLFAAAAGEPGLYIERGSSAQPADRDRLARGIYRHDFENLRDPDTGAPLPESAALGIDAWPDFWEPIRAVGFPEYLIPAVRIVADNAAIIPGAYRDQPNHVLMLEFDGTRVGLRTRFPVPVDPALSYEFSLLHRAEGLKGGRLRAGVEWMRIDSAASRLLRTDEIAGIDVEQADWPVLPARMLIDSPPPEANAARLFIIVDRDPGSIGGAYHSTVWIDNVALRPLPKIVVEPPGDEGAPGSRRVIPVRYAGLFDNVPDPANPGFFKGRRYSRRVEVTDIHNNIVDAGLRRLRPVEADGDGQAAESIPLPSDAFGVYYFNIRLYDADDRLVADVMRAVALMRPEIRDGGSGMRSLAPHFGVRAGEVPEAVVRRKGLLGGIIRRAGVRRTKIVPWRDGYALAGDNDEYYRDLAGEVRGLRSDGIAVTGVIRPPAGIFGSNSLARAVGENPGRLAEIIGEAGARLGLFIDGWQWGDDGDASLPDIPGGAGLEKIRAALAEYSGGLPIAANRVLGDLPPAPLPFRTDVVQGWYGSRKPADGLWPASARVFPWLFERYFLERGEIYPPPALSRLAPVPAADALEMEARRVSRTGSWIALESTAAYPHEPNAAAEKVQLEQFMIRAVHAAVLAPDSVYLGDLFDPSRGMLRSASGDSGMLETLARPVYLAAPVLAEQLEGAEYLGPIRLLSPFEAHVFRRPDSDDAVIALWHNDSAEERTLDRREIANGPLLSMIDWAGNRAPLPASIPVRRTPMFVTGLSAGLALTRMSVRISPEPPLLSQNRRQPQVIEIVNHMPRQVPVMLRTRYAARLYDGGMESGWTVNPEETRINLPPHSPQLVPGRVRFTVSPDPNATLQRAAPESVDKSGTKIAQASMSVNTSPPADMLLYLPFRLTSEIDMEVEALRRADDPNFLTLQLRLRWFPEGGNRRRADIRLTPYFIKRGRMKETQPFPVTVKASPPEDRGRPDAGFEAVELRIPLQPRVQTWVGVQEEGGSAFYIADVTDFFMAD